MVINDSLSQVTKALQLVAFQQWSANYQCHLSYMAGVEFEAVMDVLQTARFSLGTSHKACASRMLASVRGEHLLHARSVAVSRWRLNLKEFQATAREDVLVSEAAAREDVLVSEAAAREDVLVSEAAAREESYQQDMAAAWEIRIALTQECRFRAALAWQGVAGIWQRMELASVLGWKRSMAAHKAKMTRRNNAAARLIAMPIWMDGVEHIVIRSLLLRWLSRSTSTKTSAEAVAERRRNRCYVGASRMMAMQVWLEAGHVQRCCVLRWSGAAARGKLTTEIASVWVHCSRDVPSSSTALSPRTEPPPAVSCSELSTREKATERLAKEKARIKQEKESSSGLPPHGFLPEVRQTLQQIPARYTALLEQLTYWQAEGSRARHLFQALQTAERCLESREYEAAEAEGLVERLESALEAQAGELEASQAARRDSEGRRERELVELGRIEELEAAILKSIFRAEGLLGTTEERQLLIARNAMLCTHLEECQRGKKGVEKQKQALYETNAKLKVSARAHEQVVMDLHREAQDSQHRVAEMEATLTLSLTHHMDSSREKTDNATAETQQVRAEAQKLRQEVTTLRAALEKMEAAEAERKKKEEGGLMGSFGF